MSGRSTGSFFKSIVVVLWNRLPMERTPVRTDAVNCAGGNRVRRAFTGLVVRHASSPGASAGISPGGVLSANATVQPLIERTRTTADDDAACGCTNAGSISELPVAGFRACHARQAIVTSAVGRSSHTCTRSPTWFQKLKFRADTSLTVMP